MKLRSVIGYHLLTFVTLIALLFYFSEDLLNQFASGFHTVEMWLSLLFYGSLVIFCLVVLSYLIFSFFKKGLLNRFSSSSISDRGYQALTTPLRADFKVFFEATENTFQAVDNPTGKFPVNMAENNLCWSELKEKIQSILRARSIPDWVSNYTGMGGHSTFLEAIAKFMSVHLTKASIESQFIRTSAGATAVLELVSWLTCDTGDVAVIPAPSYPVYTQDIGNKSGVERYNLTTYKKISELKNGPKLSIQDLERAKAEIEKDKKRFKLLIITTPDNPTGLIYDLPQLQEIATWCIQNKVHLLVNELYGLSIINTQHPAIENDYQEHSPFSSFASIMEIEKSNYLHMAYGLSKDLGISGFCVGVLYSQNEELLQAYSNLNAPHLVSNLTQWVIAELLVDEDFMKGYISMNQKRLTENYVVVIEQLKKSNVPYLPSRGSLFVWIDLSKWLLKYDQQSENELWEKIYNDTGILLTPGEGFGHHEKGQFRLVYSFLQKETLEHGMRKLGEFLFVE